MRQSAVIRLIDMGIDVFLINASLSGVLAQRLVRKLCNICKQEEPISKDKKELASKVGFNNLEIIWAPQGCKACNYTGYKGRAVICELLVVTDDIRYMISKSLNVQKIRDYLFLQKVESLLFDGFSKVASGVASMDEVLKVAF